MFIEQVVLHNFRNFKGLHKFEFSKLNLIMGKIGTGKSTIGRIAVTFALYGHSEVPLKTLPTKGVKGESWVTLLIKDKGEYIEVHRAIPTKVKVCVGEHEILQESTNREKDSWIQKRFGDLQHFKKFRMIDLREGVNLLEEGKTSLKKTLVSFNESMLNNIRTNLLAKKNLYDKYNKDEAVTCTHFPSKKRLEALTKRWDKATTEKFWLEKKLTTSEWERTKIIREQASLNQRAKQNENNISRMNENRACPLCKQPVAEERKEEVVKTLVKELDGISKQYNESIEHLNSEDEALKHIKDLLVQWTKIKERTIYYKTRLSSRLAQKDYIYTTKDVLLISNAIKHLDQFYSFFILESVKTLEPIINSVICKIGFTIKFRLSEKSEFDIVLQRDGESYAYKDLSSGQRLILTISFQIALLLNKGNTGIIIADEGFSSLDNDSITTLYKLFEELPFQVISVIHRFTSESKKIRIIEL